MSRMSARAAYPEGRERLNRNGLSVFVDEDPVRFSYVKLGCVHRENLDLTVQLPAVHRVLGYVDYALRTKLVRRFPDPERTRAFKNVNQFIVIPVKMKRNLVARECDVGC